MLFSAIWQWGENNMIKTFEEPTHCLSKRAQGQSQGQQVIINECKEDLFQKWKRRRFLEGTKLLYKI